MLFEIWLSELAKQGGRRGFFFVCFGFVFDSEPFVCLRARWDAAFENDSLLNLSNTFKSALKERRRLENSSNRGKKRKKPTKHP